MGSKRFEDEFTVHVISRASMEIFDQNRLVSFWNIFNDEVQLSGDWRVALSEIMFPTKNQHVMNGDLIAYSLKNTRTHKKSHLMPMSFLDITAEKSFLSWLETLTLLLNFYSQSSEQLDYPVFCFA